MPEIIAHALAKVNLALNITGKTEDGYHKMQSIFMFLETLHDDLIFDTDKKFCGESLQIPEIYDNSIIKAAGILSENFSLKIPYVTLRKKIPIAGGLGGGSSDAACFVNAVFDLWGFSRSKKFECLEMFRPLGADAKVFLFKYFSGINYVYINGTGLDGEISEIELDMKNKTIVIANNGTKISSQEVYKNFHGAFNPELPIEDLIAHPFNSLQETVTNMYPSIDLVLDRLLKAGAVVSLVSGSGGSCFGLFTSSPVLNIPIDQFVIGREERI